MREPNYMTNWKVPGCEFTVSSQMMTDPAATSYVLEIVLERCGRDAALACAHEIRRRREEKKRLVDGVLHVFNTIGQLDIALAAVLNDGQN